MGHARASAKHAVISAVWGFLPVKHAEAMGRNVGPYAYESFFYSRIFEYTDTPLVWNMWGSSVSAEGNRAIEIDLLSGDKGRDDGSESLVAVIWLNGGTKVCGACLMGSPPPRQEAFDAMKKLVADAPAYTEDDIAKAPKWVRSICGIEVDSGASNL